MIARLNRICRYPVKGLTAEALESVDLVPGRPILHDRRYALAQGTAEFQQERPHWIRRSNFVQVANNAAVVTLQARFDPEAETLRIERHGQPFASGELGDAAGRAAIEDAFVDLLGEELRGRPRLVEIPRDGAPDADGQSFADTSAPHLSIINLASLAELSRKMGAELDPLRFRGNLYVEAPAWSEFGWVGQELQIGEATLRVTKRIDRCAATTVDPKTGERDHNVPRGLMQHYGHVDCGIYAVVVAGGTIRPGDIIHAHSTPRTA